MSEFNMRVEEPGPRRHGVPQGIRDRLSKVLDFLEDNPGRWCRVFEGKRNTASTYVNKWKKQLKDRGVEFTTRSETKNNKIVGVVFAIYRPSQRQRQDVSDQKAETDARTA